MVLNLVVTVKTGPMAAGTTEKQDVGAGTTKARGHHLRAMMVLKTSLMRFSQQRLRAAIIDLCNPEAL